MVSDVGGGPPQVHQAGTSVSAGVQQAVTVSNTDDKVRNVSVGLLSGARIDQPQKIDVTAHVQNSEQNQVVRMIMDKANAGALGKDWKEVMERVHEGKSKDVEDIMKDVEQYVTKARKFDNMVELTVEKNEAKFRVLYEEGKTDRATLIFGQSIVKLPTPGQFKKLAGGYEVTRNGVAATFLDSKERLGNVSVDILDKELTENNPDNQPGIDEARSSITNTAREQDTLTWAHENKIPGTPETRMIKYYTGKGGVIKQRIMAKYYPGGDLAGAMATGNLDDSAKRNIAVKLCKTLQRFHDDERSHNDFRPENVVLDENKNPIIIDFGGVTSAKHDTFATGSPKYFPPEMLKDGEEARKIFDAYIIADKKFSELSKMSDQLDAEWARRPDKAPKDDLVKAYEDNNAEVEKIEPALEKGQALLETEDATNIQGWVPGKNDCYALGMVLEQMYGKEPPKEIQDVIQGLKNPDPAKRLTAGEAEQMLKKI